MEVLGQKLKSTEVSIAEMSEKIAHKLTLFKHFFRSFVRQLQVKLWKDQVDFFLSTLIFCCCFVVKFCLLTLSCVQLFVTPWTVAHQAPLSMWFSFSQGIHSLELPIMQCLKTVILCTLFSVLVVYSGHIGWVSISVINPWIPFSRGSSQTRDQTRISCIGRQVFYREPPGKLLP